MTGQLEGARQATAAQWTSANPVLASGEWGHESDTNKGKVGDGSTAWNSLPYFSDVTTLAADTASLEVDLAAVVADVGVMGVWQDFTPTWTGWTPTSGTHRYTRVDKLVVVQFAITVDGVGTVTPTMTAPVTAVLPTNRTSIGTAWFSRDDLAQDLSAAHCALHTDGKIHFAEVGNDDGSFDFATSDNTIVFGGVFSYEAA